MNRRMWTRERKQYSLLDHTALLSLLLNFPSSSTFLKVMRWKILDRHLFSAYQQEKQKEKMFLQINQTYYHHSIALSSQRTSAFTIARLVKKLYDLWSLRIQHMGHECNVKHNFQVLQPRTTTSRNGEPKNFGDKHVTALTAEWFWDAVGCWCFKNIDTHQFFYVVSTA